MNKQYFCSWTYPTAIHVGAGRLAELATHCKASKIERPLLVTDSGLADHVMIARARNFLETAGLPVSVFSDVQGNPVIGNLESGIARFKQGNHDGVIAIGGGSGLDVGKLIALMAHQTIPVWDLEDVGDWWKRANEDVIAPIIAVPTTAGTGSEVGRAAVLTNTAKEEKKIIFHPKMLPSVVIGDPELAAGLPSNLTAGTGMDGFTHSFETFCVNSFHPMADGIALESMRLIKDYLPKACADGQDIEARTMMFAGAMMGGVAFQKGLGMVHSIAHALGALYPVHHGMTNAVLLPYVMEFNRPEIEAKCERVARALSIDGGYEGLLGWLLAFRAQLKVPHSLAEMGIDKLLAEKIAIKAMSDPTAATNPRPATFHDMQQVFLAAVEGKLSEANISE